MKPTTLEYTELVHNVIALHQAGLMDRQEAREALGLTEPVPEHPAMQAWQLFVTQTHAAAQATSEALRFALETAKRD